jgi:hypothetical protein
MRQDVSESSDDDYAARSHKKKVTKKTAGARDTPDSGFADSMGVWRRGAAKKVVTYDEAQADYGLESEEDEVYYPSGAATPGRSKMFHQLTPAVTGGEADEIDLVLSHSRHEDRLNDPQDKPQENLVSITPDRADGSASTSNGRVTRTFTILTRFTPFSKATRGSKRSKITLPKYGRSTSHSGIQLRMPLGNQAKKRWNNTR